MGVSECRSPGLGEPLDHLSECIYLDYNATTPIWTEVATAMQPFITQHFGNPSSIHVYGRTCKAAIEKARGQVANLIHAQPDEIYFTSCGTEADHWAIYTAVMSARKQWGASNGRLPHVVCSAIEHPAVLAYLKHMQEQGLLHFTAVPCNNEGLTDPDDVTAALTKDTVLVTIMHSNNEVGSIQPIASIVQQVRLQAANLGIPENQIVLHTDAAQSIGKVPVHVDDLGVDMLTVVGHKFGAPKGVAALYARHGIALESYLHGGGQERGRRAGTENVMLLVGLGAAAAVATSESEATTKHMATMRDRLAAGLLTALPQEAIRINGPKSDAQRLPNTLSISIRGFQASTALVNLKDQLAASAGAACHSSSCSTATISAVLKAMNVDPEFAIGTLRLSTGRHTTGNEVDAAVKLLLEEAARQGIAVHSSS